MDYTSLLGLLVGVYCQPEEVAGRGVCVDCAAASFFTMESSH